MRTPQINPTVPSCTTIKPRRTPQPEVASRGETSPSGHGAGGTDARPPAPVTVRVQYPNRLRDIVGDFIGAGCLFVMLFGGLIFGWALGW